LPLTSGTAAAWIHSCSTCNGWGYRVCRLATSNIANPGSISPAAVNYLQRPRRKPLRGGKKGHGSCEETQQVKRNETGWAGMQSSRCAGAVSNGTQVA
jgi:hypothetical protein